MRHQNTLSKNMMFGQKYQRSDTPLLLHKKDQFPQLVLSTSLEENILYSKTIHMYTGRLQHIQGEGLGKDYIHIQHILQIHHGVWGVCFGRHIPVQPTALKLRWWGITKGIVVTFFKNVCLLTKVQHINSNRTCPSKTLSKLQVNVI